MTLDPAPSGVAAVFVALADPSRRQVVGAIARTGSATSTSLAEQLGISRQAVAKHLATLGAAGLLDSERHGREVRHRLRPDPLRLAARWLEGAAGAWDIRLDRVKRQAEERA